MKEIEIKDDEIVSRLECFVNAPSEEYYSDPDFLKYYWTQHMIEKLFEVVYKKELPCRMPGGRRIHLFIDVIHKDLS